MTGPMIKAETVRKAMRQTSLLLLFLALSGTNACQENYSVGSQVQVATETPTESPTATESPTPSETPDDEPTDEPTATPTNVPTTTPTTGLGLLRELAKASEDTTAPVSGAAGSGGGRDGGCSLGDGNWLGKIYDDEEVQGASLDSDNDGYTDKLENDFDTDVRDAASHPSARTTRLADRLKGLDDDFDGLSNSDEAKFGSDPQTQDSDGDGAADGAEVLSKSSPRDPISKPPYDGDGDGLSDDYEAKNGTNMQGSDTDGDGLRDDAEAAIGANPLNNDSDGDGILDGKEVETGGDPVVAEGKSGKCP